MKKGLIIFFLILGVLASLRIASQILFPIYYIDSRSMEPTLHAGDYIVVSRFHYSFFEPKRNDIIVFHPLAQSTSFNPWVHRIIAVEGDRMSVKENQTTVNGEPALFPLLNHKDIEIDVPNSHVFQKGDNKESVAGILSERAVIGKVLFNF
jgi:signal peptidase I